MISYDYIQFLNQKALQYIPSPYIQVNNKINMRCPFCGDSHKSLTKKRGWWYNQTASYYCFNCGLSLSGIKFIENLSGEDYQNIKKEYLKLFIKSGQNYELSSFSEKPSSEPNIFSFKNIIKDEWKQPLTNDAIKYLEERGIFKSPFLKDPIYSVFNSDKSQEYILIPWRINGIDAYYQLNDFKKIHSMKYIFPKNKNKLIYGLDNVDPTYNKIFIFEGVYDSLFVKNGISVGTKAITQYQLNILKQRWPNHQICISFDNDKAGIASSIKYIEGNNDFKYFKWFNKNTKQKDINEYVLFKNNFNIFSNTTVLDKLILNKLQMKMYLIENNLWKKEESKYYKSFQKNNQKISLDKKSVFLIK